MKNDKQKWINKQSNDLFEAILELKDIEEARNFFRDLLTAEEIIEFSRRFQVAKMLEKDVPYSEIEKKTGMSSTTIARVSKWLNSGMGGYKKIIKRLSKNKVNHHSPA